MTHRITVRRKNLDTFLVGLVVLEIFLVLLFVFALILPSATIVFAGVGSPNVTVTTLLNVGNVFPEVLNVTINFGNATLDLIPNSTVNLTVYTVLRDYNGDGDIFNVTLRFYDTVNSSYSGTDDNNWHYTNDTCSIDRTYGDAYEANATCTLAVWYYANSGLWNGTIFVSDNESLTAESNDTIVINSLLALSLPSSIDYGTVNATAVSLEQMTNVTNAGNVGVNVSLSGYATFIGDNLAMNCTLGTIKNISINYEKYNLTAPTGGVLTLPQFEAAYINLSASPVVKRMDIRQRQNDTVQFFDETNGSYWRIYVPLGVAGSCRGNVVFGAVQSSGT